MARSLETINLNKTSAAKLTKLFLSKWRHLNWPWPGFPALYTCKDTQQQILNLGYIVLNNIEIHIFDVEWVISIWLDQYDIWLYLCGSIYLEMWSVELSRHSYSHYIGEGDILHISQHLYTSGLVIYPHIDSWSVQNYKTLSSSLYIYSTKTF